MICGAGCQCPTRVSSKSVLQEYQESVSSTRVLQERQERVSYKTKSVK